MAIFSKMMLAATGAAALDHDQYNSLSLREKINWNAQQKALRERKNRKAQEKKLKLLELKKMNNLDELALPTLQKSANMQQAGLNDTSAGQIAEATQLKKHDPNNQGDSRKVPSQAVVKNALQNALRKVLSDDEFKKVEAEARLETDLLSDTESDKGEN